MDSGKATDSDLSLHLITVKYLKKSCRCEIWISDSCDDKGSRLLGYNAIKLVHSYRRCVGDRCLHLQGEINPEYGKTVILHSFFTGLW
jgi:hypothetical protein